MYYCHPGIFGIAKISGIHVFMSKSYCISCAGKAAEKLAPEMEDRAY
jgi:hypothetical protein